MQRKMRNTFKFFIFYWGIFRLAFTDQVSFKGFDPTESSIFSKQKKKIAQNGPVLSHWKKSYF